MDTSTSLSLLLGMSPNKKKAAPEPTRSLASIIAENEVREHNLDYQQLLIESKEL